MTNLKKLFAGLVLAAGVMLAPVTAFAADGDEFVEETAITQEASDIVISIPVSTETVTETAPSTEEVADAASANATDVVEETVDPASEQAPATGEEVAAANDAANEVADNANESATEEAADTAVTGSTETVEQSNEQTPDDEKVAGDTVTEDQASEEATQPAQAETPVSEQAPATGEEVAAANDAANEVADNANESATEEAADTAVTGVQVGDANRGYAHMSDDSDAFCVEVEKDHIEEDQEYTREDNVDGSQFNNIFVARQNELDNEQTTLSAQDINSITQLAIWAVLSGDSYADLVDFYYHEAGTALYERMFAQYEGDWTFKYWSYIPGNDVFQKLIAGSAQKVTTPVEPDVPEEPEEPEPENPEPEEPTPEEPQPENPEPETPQPENPVPDEPTPVTPEPEQPTPVEPTQPTEDVPVLSETFEAPVTSSVPVLSARMASTGDTTNTAMNMVILLAAVATMATLLSKKESN